MSSKMSREQPPFVTFPLMRLASIALANDAKTPDGQDVHMFAEEFKDGGIRRFIVETTPNFWHIYRNIDHEHKHYYEVITEGSPCKLYFDLEFNKDLNPDKDGDAMVNIFIKYVCYHLSKQFGVSCDRSHVLDLDSSTVSKFSRHLIFNEPNAVFKDNIQAGTFVKQVCEAIKENSSVDDAGELKSKIPRLEPGDHPEPMLREKKDDENHGEGTFVKQVWGGSKENSSVDDAGELKSKIPRLEPGDHPEPMLREKKDDENHGEGTFVKQVCGTTKENSSVDDAGEPKSKIPRLEPGNHPEPMLREKKDDENHVQAQDLQTILVKTEKGTDIFCDTGTYVKQVCEAIKDNSSVDDAGETKSKIPRLEPGDHPEPMLREKKDDENHGEGTFVKQVCGASKESSSVDDAGDLKSKIPRLEPGDDPEPTLREKKDDENHGEVPAQDLQTLLVKTEKGTDIFCDTAVYSRNRNFRLFESAKFGKSAKLVVAEQNTFKLNSKETSNRKNVFLASLITNISGDKIPLRCGQGRQPSSKAAPKTRRGKEGSLDAIDTGSKHSPYPKIDKFISESNILSKGGRQGWIRKCSYCPQSKCLVYEIEGNRWCDNKNGEHKSNHIKIVVNMKKCTYYQKCHDPDCKRFKSQARRLPNNIGEQDDDDEDIDDGDDDDVTEVEDDDIDIDDVDDDDVTEEEEDDDRFPNLAVPFTLT